MPSSQQPMPAKPRGIFLRKKMAEFMNPSLRSGSKICAGVTKNRGGGNTSSSSSSSTTSTTTQNNDESNCGGGGGGSDCGGAADNAITKTTSTSTSTSTISSSGGCSRSSSGMSENTATTVRITGGNGGSLVSPKHQNVSQISTASISVQQNNNNTANDGNNNVTTTFSPPIYSATAAAAEQQMSSSSTNQQNTSFATASRVTNESSMCGAAAANSGTATTFSTTTSSSSSSHQRLHRQITREMKTSCIKSDLSELKSSFAEMNNLTKYATSSFENMMDSPKEATMITDSGGGGAAPGNGEPVITYPDSPTPTSGSGVLIFPCGAGSRKNSLVTTEEVIQQCSTPTVTIGANELNFEQKRSLSAASRTKMITQQFKTQESVIAANATEKSIDARHEQRMTTENKTHQQSQNVGCSSLSKSSSSSSSSSSSYVRMQAEAFAEKAQRQLSSSSSSSSGMIAQHSNFSSTIGYTTMSHRKQSNDAFIESEKNTAIAMARQIAVTDHMKETFEDLDALHASPNQQDLDRALTKYTGRLKQVVDSLKESNCPLPNAPNMVLNKLSEMVKKAWTVPTHGLSLGTRLCDELRSSGGLDMLITNCNSKDNDVKFSSAMLLEQCLTSENRDHVVDNGLEKVVRMAGEFTKQPGKTPNHSRISTGILAHLFKHSGDTCENVIKMGGLNTVLYECRNNDVETLRHCANALANLSLYGGVENHEEMIKNKVPVWLFPLAFHTDDNIKYYACLAIAALVANKEMEASVLKSGTLDLVEPFVLSHSPEQFARSNVAHFHGQSPNWLKQLVPVLSSKREEARSLAAFHFCMEAGIKNNQGNARAQFLEIGAIESLQKVASCPNRIASKFAAQALKTIGEIVPHKLIQQVPQWSVEDVKQWVKQIGFQEYCDNFEQSRVDGDLLLQLTEENLKIDLEIKNGIRRRRFERELQNLKKMADYSSRDKDNLNSFLQNVGSEFTVYTYSLLNAGVDRDYLKLLSQEQLLYECGITNSIHRLRILENIKTEKTLADTFNQDSEKPLDAFISYRRSNGSQLASLLKVHLQVRNFSVFLDVEKLEAGKFDNNLLQSIKQASNLILVLTPDSLERCINDVDCKDWVHREIVTALQSQCNIIPITADNFQWPQPDQLPEDMQAICRFNGIRWIHDYQDACVDKLERFIKGEVSSRSPNGDLAVTTPHGGRTSRNDLRSQPSYQTQPSYQRTQSSDGTREVDSSKE